jgi:hypothetical protein
MQASLKSRQTIGLDIAGLPLALLTDAPSVAFAARTRFATSLADGDCQPLLLTDVSMEREPPARREAPELEIDGNHIQVAGGGFEGCVDRGAGHAELRVGPIDTDIALENYFRIVTAILILERGGILLHSSAAIRRGEGFVFFGQSEAGKSTVAQLSHQLGHPVLSDDQNVLYPSGEDVLLHGVPFRGGQCPVATSPGIARVRRLLSLYKDSHAELESVPVAVGAALLSTQVPLVNWQPGLMERVLANCAEIARRVPVEILHFRRDPEFWQIL